MDNIRQWFTDSPSTLKVNNPDYQYLIEEFPDFFIKDKPSYFVQFAGYRTWINTDGSLFFQERDKNRCEEPIFALLSSNVRSGLRFGGNKQEIVPINLQNTSYYTTDRTIECIRIMVFSTKQYTLCKRVTLEVQLG